MLLGSNDIVLLRVRDEMDINRTQINQNIVRSLNSYTIISELVSLLHTTRH